MLRWQPPPLSGQNGKITGYKIRYRKGSRRSESETTEGTQLYKLMDGNELKKIVTNDFLNKSVLFRQTSGSAYECIAFITMCTGRV